MAKWLALQTSDHKVQAWNTTGGGSQFMTVWHFIAQSFPLSSLDIT